MPSNCTSCSFQESSEPLQDALLDLEKPKREKHATAQVRSENEGGCPEVAIDYVIFALASGLQADYI